MTGCPAERNIKIINHINESTIMKKENYIAPEFLVDELRTEAGFAQSGGQKTRLMSMKNSPGKLYCYKTIFLS